MVIECIINGKRKTLSLEEYLDREKRCFCGGRGNRVCLCPAGETAEDHLRRLEEDGLGRARIINKKEYAKSREVLTRKRPVLLRKSPEKTVKPF